VASKRLPRCEAQRCASLPQRWCARALSQHSLKAKLFETTVEKSSPTMLKRGQSAPEKDGTSPLSSTETCSWSKMVDENLSLSLFTHLNVYRRIFAAAFLLSPM
jgi:hypothetical protein